MQLMHDDVHGIAVCYIICVLASVQSFTLVMALIVDLGS